MHNDYPIKFAPASDKANTVEHDYSSTPAAKQYQDPTFLLYVNSITYAWV